MIDNKLFSLTRDDLRTFFVEELGQKKYQADQIFRWFHHEGIIDYQAMTNLSQELRTRLQAEYPIEMPEFHVQSTQDTVKFLMKTTQGSWIESVIIPHTGRSTLCVSTQAGCPVGCTFCATGKQPFYGHLKTFEIIAQIWIAHFKLGYPVNNLVFMGMGEPLLNTTAVIQACQMLMDDFGYGLAKRRITISTAGLIPGIEQITGVLDVELAVSLHAATDELRSQIVPINKKYPIEPLLKAACAYLDTLGPKRKITFEYALIKDINDSKEDALNLKRLLAHIPSKVNIIPFNAHPYSDYERPDQKQIDCFMKTLLNSGIFCSVRETRGNKSQSACGQLVGMKKTESPLQSNDSVSSITH